MSTPTSTPASNPLSEQVMRVLALVAAVAGVILILDGVYNATPIAGAVVTEGDLHHARLTLAAATGLLLLAATLLTRAGRRRHAVFVGSSGPIVLLVNLADPGGYDWIALLVLGPLALGAALLALGRRR